MQSASESQRAVPGRPIRILLLEDVAATAEVVKAYLDAASGAAVVESVDTLGAALERLANGAFDLVLADLNVPDSTGLETLDRLAKATDRLIIVLTVEEGQELREAAIARGAYDFLHKSQLSRAALGRIVRLATIQANTFRSLRESEARFRSLTELSSDFYWESDAGHRIVQTSHGAKHRAVNVRGSQIGKTRWEIPSTGPDAGGWLAHRATLDAHLPFRDFELSRLDARGVERHLSISGEPVFDEGGAFAGYRGVGRDISSRKQAEERIQDLATRDALTGLPNRVLLGDRFSQKIAQARRHGTLLGVLFVDLDGFKLVNDSLGHAAGDELLKETARRLEASVRAGDTVGRISGDEFAVILGDLERPDFAALVAQKIIEGLAAPVQLAGKETFVTASVGVAMFPADGDNAETLLAAADASMYQAKQLGRNNYQFFTAEIHQRTRARARLGTELRRAVEYEEYVLAYQPKYDLSGDVPCAAEALLRWNHPTRGMVYPAEFISILEDTGQIVTVGEWVLRRVCEDLKEWQAGGLKPLPVAVNLSARQLRQPDLDVRIRSVLDGAGIDPALIELEITESQLMHDPVHAIRIVRALSASGIRVALDDFGTGYSSLAYLSRLPVDSLKIDRSFIREMTDKQEDVSIVSTIISLAKSLRLKVIAEGVETKEQARYLRLMRCDEAQGYFFARPMPAAAFKALLTRSS